MTPPARAAHNDDEEFVADPEDAAEKVSPKRRCPECRAPEDEGFCGCRSPELED